MVDVRTKRHRGRSRRAKARRLRAILAVVTIGVLLALASLFRPIDSRPAGEAGLNRPAGSNPGNAIELTASAAPRRPTYNYSVIPGGAWDEHELTDAVQRDPVVANHYREVDTASMRSEVLKSDLLAHVSYRVDDRVYWTKRKVRIRSGETILTDGQTLIRARCGNCISLAPLMPTSEDEPAESQLDALTDIGPVVVSWNWTPFGAPLAAGSLGSGEADGGPGLVNPPQLPPPFPFGLAPFPTGPVAGVPTETLLAVNTPPVGFPDAPPPGAPPFGGTPPFGGGAPPFGGGSPDSDAPGGTTPGGPGLGSFETPGNESTPPTFPPTVPSNTTPVPEPATFLLLGSGIAALFARHRRSKKN